MAKNQIEIDKDLLEQVRPLAVKNGIKPNAENLVNLSLKVTAKMLKNLDSSDFEKLCNLKK